MAGVATYKVLGQDCPSGTTETTLYTVPSNTSAVVSSLTLCNRTASSAVIDVNVRPAGAAVAAKHSLLYQVAIPGRFTQTLTLGISLAATDVVSIKQGTGSAVAVSLFGTEIS